MKDAKIVSRMCDYAYRAAKALAAWLSDILPGSGPDWWEECVMSNLSTLQYEKAIENHITKLEQFDLAALLRIAEKSWYIMTTYHYMPQNDRETIKDMKRVRTNWAHTPTVLLGKDTIITDIVYLTRFFQMIGNDSIISELDDFKARIERPDLYDQEEDESTSRSEPVESPSVEPPVETTPVVTEDNHTIKERSLVYVVGSPATKGMVFSISDLGETRKYEVFVDGEIKTFYEGQIALVEETAEYEWVSADMLRSCLSAYQINNPSAGNLYSLNAARIDFVPYQFRPALKLIKADEPRILIADSVGVGKTIEAGLIIKELQARSDLENIMIICPKPLVADRKWENEMKRFDEEFITLDGDSLGQAISDTDRDGEWPVRFGKTIVPYSILDSRTYEGEETKRHKTFGLVDLDPAPHFDLVIIDEAHHLRNGSMEKEKAFAYKCVHYFCEHADAVVMLTATPLQTSDDDLFTLLNLLRPDVVIDKQSFTMMARPNPFLSQASHLVRAAKENWKSEALDALNQVLATQWGENVISKNPKFEEIRSVLQQETITREERVKLITDIESLHSFNMMLNRTRRKDIQDFCIRRTHTLETDFTPAQRELHDALLAFEVAALTKLHGARGVKFMMSTIRRQAASCIFGLAPYIRDLINRRYDQLMDDPDDETDGGDLQYIDINDFQDIAQHILELADHLPEEDPKIDSILEIIRAKKQMENNKIILFSTFRHTLHYVRRKLLAAGIRVEQIDGSVNNDKRLELRYRFELPKEDPEAIDVMLFTEVGSEGLDYQFCDMMINYDLPWNPMRIEQRIGRIDRRGQKSEAVNIYNAITSDTVDADIYDRCLARIGVFEGSIGECEEILGEIGRQIELIALDTNLTDEERKIKLEQMADNEVRKAQEMTKLENEEKELFGFDLSNYTVSREILEAESPFLTARSMQHLVENYLNERIGAGNYIQGDSLLKNLKLSALARSVLMTDLRSMGGYRDALRRKWELYLKGNEPNHPLTFDAETAERNRNAFFITPVHPLVKQAAVHFASSKTVNIHLEMHSDEIPAGDYPMSVYAWNYVGIRSNFRLMTICENEQLATELPEYILTATAVDYSTKLKKDAWKVLEEKHVHLWQEERDKHVEQTRQTASYKLESLKNNYLNRKLLLERKIAEDIDDRIALMHKTELENATVRYEQKVKEIEKQIERADILIEPVANGVVTVK